MGKNYQPDDADLAGAAAAALVLDAYETVLAENDQLRRLVYAYFDCNGANAFDDGSELYAVLEAVLEARP